MKRLALALVLLAACRDTGVKKPELITGNFAVTELEDNGIGEPNSYVVHDKSRSVTCWYVGTPGNGGGLSCLPDWQLRAPETKP